MLIARNMSDPGETGFRIVPRNLAVFIALTTSNALIERPAFPRRLHRCNWYAVGRADQKYCTARRLCPTSNLDPMFAE